MNLPNYFLADLPLEATLNASLLAEACQTLKRNREQYLLSRSTESLIGVLHELGHNWLDDDFPFRSMALESGPALTGFSSGTLAAGLNGFFRQLTAENLRKLIEQDLCHDRRLFEFAATDLERTARRSSLARGPELIAFFGPGNVPNPTLLSIVLGLLIRSAQFVKCSSGASFLPRLFAHSLYETEPKLGACLEVAEWRGGDRPLEGALFQEADCVIATGSDETLGAIRQRVPSGTRFIGYGHRLSFGYIAKEAFTVSNLSQVAEKAATDVTAWNQLGCLSPHVFYIEHGGRVSAEQFAEMLSTELEKKEDTEPRGAVPADVSALISSRRAFYEVRAAHSPETRHWFSKKSTAWTVVYEADPLFQISCLHRFVYVKSVTGVAEVLRATDRIRGQVSTVGLAAGTEQARKIATELAAWGVTRVCPLGQMQNPPLPWRHDGRPALGDLVTWTDWEQ
jgi:hypothetical protein